MHRCSQAERFFLFFPSGSKEAIPILSSPFNLSQNNWFDPFLGELQISGLLRLRRRLLGRGGRLLFLDFAALLQDFVQSPFRCHRLFSLTFGEILMRDALQLIAIGRTVEPHAFSLCPLSPPPFPQPRPTFLLTTAP